VVKELKRRSQNEEGSAGRKEREFTIPAGASGGKKESAG